MKIPELKSLLAGFLRQAVLECYGPEVVAKAESLLSGEDLLVPCKNPAHGDFSTNLAFRLASPAKQSPYEVAQQLSVRVCEKITASASPCQRLEIIMPGFMNFVFSAAAYADVVPGVLSSGARFGSSLMGQGRKVLVEFVSANPTGPLTVAHGRQAAVGDSLANILDFAGFSVSREYYLNDRGRQMDMLALSARARYMQEFDPSYPFPEDGYRGDYMIDIGRAIKAAHGDRWVAAPDTPEKHMFFLDFAKDTILAGIRKDLDDFRVRFDTWFSERGYATPEVIAATLAELKAAGFLYEQEGAQWLRSTALGDDKDRVLVKSSGEFTYITPDLAYHAHKLRRGFNRLVNLWGPDHHGYISRLKAGLRALGFDDKALDVLIVQLCTLFRGKEKVQMSTRAGQFISLREVMDEVGADATRYHFLMIKPESHLNFDLQVAKSQSMENPVYYLQYAHARICSVFDKFAEQTGSAPDFGSFKMDLSLLKELEEIQLVRLLTLFEGAVCAAARSLDPHEVIIYLQDLATAFHSYYNKFRVIGDNAPLMHTRLLLLRAVQIVLRNGLTLLGMSAPAKM